MVATAVSSTIAILAQVILGFAIVWTQGLSLSVHNDDSALGFLMNIQAVCLGIACLVSILAHAVGLFLQQEDFSRANRLRRDEEDNPPPANVPLYPGYILALIAFAISALLGVVAILVTGLLLLALLAYYRDLWRRLVLGPTCLAGATVLAVLLGAAAGGWSGDVMLPTLYLACLVPSAYAWASETTVNRLPRRGLGRWQATLVAGAAGAILTTWAFCSQGLVALGPWLSVWLSIWLLARTGSLSHTLGQRNTPLLAHTLRCQFQRGELLLLGNIMVVCLPEWQGTLAFASVFVAFPLLALLGRR